MKIRILIVISLFIYDFTSGQPYQTDSDARSEMARLQFMTGHWQGSGWMMGRDGQKHHFSQSEDVQFKLDSTLLLIEGMGKSEGKVIHHALAVVSCNEPYQQYTFQSFLSDGKNGSFKGELINGKFYWYTNENIRYVVGLNDMGQWHESGEMKREEGWFQFFEMILDREK